MVRVDHGVREAVAISMPVANGAHEFIVAPELAEVAERPDVPLHAGDRVRFEVIEGGDAPGASVGARLSWLGSEVVPRSPSHVTQSASVAVDASEPLAE